MPLLLPFQGQRKVEIAVPKMFVSSPTSTPVKNLGSGHQNGSAGKSSCCTNMTACVQSPDPMLQRGTWKLSSGLHMHPVTGVCMHTYTCTHTVSNNKPWKKLMFKDPRILGRHQWQLVIGATYKWHYDHFLSLIQDRHKQGEHIPP